MSMNIVIAIVVLYGCVCNVWRNSGIVFPLTFPKYKRVWQMHCLNSIVVQGWPHSYNLNWYIVFVRLEI